MKITLTQRQKEWLHSHLRVLIYGTVGWMLVDGIVLLTQTYQGAWDWVLLGQLIQLILVSFVKALFNQLFPSIFPPPSYPKKTP